MKFKDIFYDSKGRFGGIEEAMNTDFSQIPYNKGKYWKKAVEEMYNYTFAPVSSAEAQAWFDKNASEIVYAVDHDTTLAEATEEAITAD